MLPYIGCKIILAEPQMRSGVEPGYAILYPDGYRSWSPAQVFEEAYRQLNPGEVDIATGPHGRKKTFFDRLLGERKDLSGKIDKLRDFTDPNLNGLFSDLDPESQNALHEQLVHMENYLAVLDRRIAANKPFHETDLVHSEDIGEIRTTGGGSVETPIPFKD